ncbi:Scr1 family TA system antitoxin-like transcriptional regulator [Plantactinospora sp. B5E13]|uniref:DUF5753 domain-containing protein n=1 Tax=Plantactinospora sp. B5E13 TaxID=3153758 RepID=UPI00325E9F60
MITGAADPASDTPCPGPAAPRPPGWWYAYRDAIPDWFTPYLRLEAVAHRLREHADLLVPGLLQTPEYAYAVFQTRLATSDDDRDRLTEVRLHRQRLLRRHLPPPPRLDVILSEAVLLRVVGGRATMAGQLRRLCEASELPYVTIRVVPLAAGAHHGAVAGAFTLLDFPPDNEPPDPSGVPSPDNEPPNPSAVPSVDDGPTAVRPADEGSNAGPSSLVYREFLTGALYLDDVTEVDAYQRIWTSLDTLALDEHQSRHLIDTIRREVHHG